MDGGPEVFEAGSGFGGAEEDIFHLQAFFEGGLGFAASVAGELVGFCGDDDEVAARLLEKFDELDVGLLRRNVAVHEAEAEGEGGALGEVRLDEFWPLGGDGFGDFGVAVSGQVGEIHLRLLALGRVGDREEVDGAGASGSGGDFGLFGVEQGIEQAGFADVGASQEGDFRNGGRRELCGREGGEKEFGMGAHQRIGLRAQGTGLRVVEPASLLFLAGRLLITEVTERTEGFSK